MLSLMSDTYQNITSGEFKFCYYLYKKRDDNNKYKVHALYQSYTIMLFFFEIYSKSSAN